MTPHEIDLLMHYYTRAHDHPDASHRMAQQTFCDLARADLLVKLEEPTLHGATWRLTERGEVYCAAVCAVPLPVQRWVMPEGAERLEPDAETLARMFWKP